MNGESASTGRGAVREGPDQPQFLLATLPPERGQRRTALAAVLTLLVVFAVTAPFTTIQLPVVDAFISVFQTAVLISDLITAAMLFAQFTILRWRALLALASGYFFTALIVIPHAFTFPGLFAPTGLLGAGLQSTAWLYFFWHLGLPLAVIVYALLKDADSALSSSEGAASTAIGLSVIVVLVLVCVLTWIATAQEMHLPRLLDDEGRLSLFAKFIGVIPLSLGVLALALVWIRQRSVLDLWLMVVIVAFLIELVLSALVAGSRFSLGYYSGRIYSLITAMIVLLVLLSQTTTLYARLGRSMMMQRREREGRHMTMDSVTASIAHEVNQPLAAIVANGNAALRFLAKATPDLDEVREAVQCIVSDGHRASQVLESIRSMFKRGDHEGTLLDINKLIRDTLVLVLGEQQSRHVSVQIKLNEKLTNVKGNRVHLQQVVLNLVMNALEAMSAVTNRQRVLRLRTEVHEPDGVLVSVEDSGAGIDPKDINRIFEPFFTTKSQGMGMGLCICRSIVEAHGGRLWASDGLDHGAVFNILLPAVGPGVSK